MKKIVYLAIFLISCSVFIFEIILLKFLAFKIISSWAFLVISIAFLGIGASGTYLYLRKDKKEQDDFLFLSKVANYFSISIPLSIIIFALIPFSPSHSSVFLNVLFNFFYIILFSIPFFLSGVCISYILSLKGFPPGKVIFFDLMGAACGSLMTILMLRILGAYGLLILATSFAYLAFIIFYSSREKVSILFFKKPLALTPILFCIILFFYPFLMVRFFGFDIISTNREEVHFTTFKEDFNGIQATYWNPITRIDLSKEGQSRRYVFLFGLSEKYQDKEYVGRYILSDGGAATRQFKISQNREDNEFLEHFLFSAPYQLKNNIDNVLIIGPGGGLEVLIAKYFRVKNVDGVDINSEIIKILKGENKKDPLKDVYSSFTLSDDETKVNYYTEEGRSFLSKKLESKYDIIQLTGVDLLSVLMSGGMILSENYLYTKEAFNYYYGALRENGYLQVSYWGGPYALRLFITALEMLEDKNGFQPERSLIVIDDGKNYTDLIVKKGVFSNEEIDVLKEIIKENNFRLIYYPDLKLNPADYILTGEVNTQHYLLASEKKNRGSLIENLAYNVKPVSDNNPFFYSVRSAEKGNIFKKVFITFFQSKIILIFTLLGIGLSFTLILSPIILKRIRLKTIEKIPFNFLFFFGILGFAFSLLEIIILQKLSIFVGGPLYSMALTLPTILIFYSLGSFLTYKITIEPKKLLIIIFCVIVLYGMFSYFFLDAVIKKLFYFNHFERMIFSALITAPIGFFIGFPVPLVLRVIKSQTGSSIIPLVWGVNSYGNVIGALLFAPLSQFLGFNLLLLISCFLYPFAGLFLIIKRNHEDLFSL